jgi:oligosaccharide reducing-end xylanase
MAGGAAATSGGANTSAGGNASAGPAGTAAGTASGVAGGAGSGGLGVAGAGGIAAGGAAAGGTVGAGGAGAGGALGGSGGTTSGGGATGGGGTRAACAAPSGYRNLFVESLGKASADVDAKVNAGVQQLFHGASGQNIYFELGTDQAYIEDIANNDVRSEGQSYGMTIAVQMDMKVEFDKLWTYASQCMRQASGLFAWQMNVAACTAKSTGAAPDGEEYFAMALMLASRRWGDAGTYNYGSEAKKVMAAMLAARPAGEFNSNPALVTFGPYQNFSDPSYVLPLFYSEWACFDTAHADFWKQATTYGRSLFQKTTNATTGLAPGQCNWDGTPYTAGSAGHYNYDAQRVPMNIMADLNLNNADPWQATWAQKMAAFWVKEGLAGYGDTYNLDGSGKSGTHGAGPTAMNAMLAFTLPAADGKPFLQAAWDAAVPTGTYRYYSGSLYVLAMLHLSGKFRLAY